MSALEAAMKVVSRVQEKGRMNTDNIQKTNSVKSGSVDVMGITPVKRTISLHRYAQLPKTMDSDGLDKVKSAVSNLVDDHAIKDDTDNTMSMEGVATLKPEPITIGFNKRDYLQKIGLRS